VVKMYVIIVYDIEVDKVSKVCYFLRRYLNWIQNSVFEGELTPSQLFEIKRGLKSLIDEKKDSIIIYKMRTEEAFKREYIGVEKTDLSTVI